MTDAEFHMIAAELLPASLRYGPLPLEETRRKVAEKLKEMARASNDLVLANSVIETIGEVATDGDPADDFMLSFPVVAAVTRLRSERDAAREDLKDEEDNGDKLSRRAIAAEKLCQIYFEIAERFISAEEIRRIRDEKIGAAK